MKLGNVLGWQCTGVAMYWGGNGNCCALSSRLNILEVGV